MITDHYSRVRHPRIAAKAAPNVRVGSRLGHSAMSARCPVCRKADPARAPLPKFVIHRGTLSHELRKQRGTSKHMILVPLFDLTFLNELAAGGVGTSNRRH